MLLRLKEQGEIRKLREKLAWDGYPAIGDLVIAEACSHDSPHVAGPRRYCS